MSEVVRPLSPRLSRRAAIEVLDKGINYPLFVPETGRRLEEYLRRGSADELLAALEQLATTGSDNASALLTYLNVVWSVRGSEDTVRSARERCVAAAQRGDPYAMYVVAWECLRRGDTRGAWEWMMKSATKGLFLPAFIDVGRIALEGVGFTSPDRTAALSIFWQAHRLGHRMGLVYVARSLMEGAKGWLGRALGLFIYLPALIRSFMYRQRNPLSEKIFVTPVAPKHPLFKQARETQ